MTATTNMVEVPRPVLEELVESMDEILERNDLRESLTNRAVLAVDAARMELWLVDNGDQ